jgi:hypothetical protein
MLTIAFGPNALNHSDSFDPRGYPAVARKPPSDAQARDTPSSRTASPVIRPPIPSSLLRRVASFWVTLITCDSSLLHPADDLLEHSIGERTSITTGRTRIPARASIPVNRRDERCLSRLSERSCRAPRLRRSRCSLQSPMADHRRR